MSHQQCWGLHSDRRRRCKAPALADGFFCERHGSRQGPHVVDIFCLPEAAMPPRLVRLIRHQFPDFTFPKSASPAHGMPLATMVPFESPRVAPAIAGPKPTTCADPPPPRPALPPPGAALAEDGPLDWLLQTLRTAIEGVMADEAVKPLQKANAVSRLGNLYLKTYRAAELTRENKALARRIAELEQALAAAPHVGHERFEAVAAPASPAPRGVSRNRANRAAAPPGAGGPAQQRAHSCLGHVVAESWHEEDMDEEEMATAGPGCASP